MNLNAKIFVAGHRGLVGSAILRRLASSGYGNIVVRTREELDLQRQNEVEEFFEKERPEYVFLAAAKVGGILANSTYPGQFIHRNLAIQTHVIHSAYLSGVRKLLFLGSSCIYPKHAAQPMKEECLLTGPLEPTNEPYAVAKIAGIKMCEAYNRQYGTDFISVMPTNLYGPGDNFDLETSHVMPAMVRKFHLAKCVQQGDLDAVRADIIRFPVSGRVPGDVTSISDEAVISLLSHFGILISSRNPCGLSPDGLGACRLPASLPVSVVLWGTGTPYREFLHVDDLADACVFLMEKDGAGGITNIGTGADLTISELAGMVEDVVGFGGEIAWDASRPDGAPRKLLDVTRANSLGWRPKISLRDGIATTYEWYVSQTAKQG